MPDNIGKYFANGKDYKVILDDDENFIVLFSWQFSADTLTVKITAPDKLKVETIYVSNGQMSELGDKTVNPASFPINKDVLAWKELVIHVELRHTNGTNRRTNIRLKKSRPYPLVVFNMLGRE